MSCAGFGLARGGPALGVGLGMLDHPPGGQWIGLRDFFMPVCPECSYAFSKAENILPAFRPKICPRCGIRLKKAPNRYHQESVFIWMVGNAYLAAYDQVNWKALEWLQLNREQLIYGWTTLWMVFYYVVVFFSGEFIRFQPQPPLLKRIKEVFTYKPMFPDLRFKRAWLMPIGFFIGLLVLVACLILLSNRIAHSQ